jgi:phosphoribosylamine---glycine ligase
LNAALSLRMISLQINKVLRMKYRILVLGGGGREHAMVSKIVESSLCEACFCAPGNPGIAMLSSILPVGVEDFEGIEKIILDHKINMVVVGPEVPLVLGVTDYLKSKFEDIIIVGPSKVGAMLEGSKAVAKEFMKRHNVPTASYIEVTNANLEEGLAHIATGKGPYVLKADGLASGKGVLIIDDVEEAKIELKAMVGGKFGGASEKVVIEQFLSGIEFSLFALTDGKDYILLPEAKDYKRIGEGDTGLNTGGMGAISPVPFYSGDFKNKVIASIVKPTIEGLKKDQIDYKGFVFFGLIKVGDLPYVIEYNCRMGDPETEAVFPRITSDIVEAFVAMDQGKLSDYTFSASEMKAATVITVSGGYPESFEKGYEIEGLHLINDSIIFHSGTSSKDGKVVTAGGRVLAITTLAPTKEEAVSKSLAAAEKISYKNKYFRKDIGFDL